MTSTLTEFSAGHQFEPITFAVDVERARAYREAVADDLPLYEAAGLAPPLAVTALALGLLLQAVALPPGSLHGSESMQCYRPVPLGALLECRSHLAQRSQRSGWIASVLQSEIIYEGAVAISARATVLTPMAEA